MTSIGPISSAGTLSPVNAAQSAGTQGVRHHPRQATASDPDGDGVPDAPSSSATPPASALSAALNTMA